MEYSEEEKQLFSKLGKASAAKRHANMTPKQKKEYYDTLQAKAIEKRRQKALERQKLKKELFGE